MKIYADNAATTKLDMDAFEVMKPFLLDYYANASQPYSFSRKCKKALSEARETISECINAKPEEIFFTSGGTESDNWAIKNFYSQRYAHSIVTSCIEHHAILNACNNSGSTVNFLAVDKYGSVLPSQLDCLLNELVDKNITSPKVLISIMLANNEIGTIQPIKECAKKAHIKGALFHTDAVQAIGHIPVDVKELDVDMLSASAHKFNGPKGIGFLYSKNPNLVPLHDGGLQESGQRAGTENIPAIVGMAAALKKNCEQMQENISHLRRISELFFSELKKKSWIILSTDTLIKGFQEI